MKERPILFSGPMVRAILEGRKTVTRRAIKPQPFIDGSGNFCWNGGNYGQNENGPRSSALASPIPCSKTKRVACPYGRPGDRLWVRETWARVGNADPGYLVYRATYPACLPPGLERVPADIRNAGYRWRPSIHMPRVNSRILLEITDVRVERLQDISEEQTLAEGIDLDRLADSQERYDMVADHNMTGRPTAVGAFRDLWASINGIESWDANPWVWVVEFKRVTP